ncbi:hypothetical protein TSARBOMBA_202 [Bacillus phage TsarBomba]|uniref:Uncharacterized protein n=1 Tax=Bacillus phage TsarBomba TaxID=1690456 RepID=A0A0K2D082_9CAUD|nr:hypothetical protein TSARBOMBA_202 [Bacillus phage TsarBomba]ALA13234.1 hypothetical protein TSARBOMBA_202 [Bacillus phage TsarBomba]
MKEQTIVVPVKDSKEGLSIVGTKVVVALWECPKCGKELETPYLDILTVNGQPFAVHHWKTKCGHRVPYTELNLVDRYYLKDKGEDRSSYLIDFSLDYHNSITMHIDTHDFLDLHLTPQQALDVSEKLRALATRAYGRMKVNEGE